MEDQTKYKNPKPTTDIVIVFNESIVLIKRGREPFKDMWALPGGFIDYGEEPYQAAIREAKEETNLDVIIDDIKRPVVFGNPDRDPRWHLISNVFKAEAKNIHELKAGDDAADVKLFKKEELPEKLAADHREMIKEILGW